MIAIKLTLGFIFAYLLGSIPTAVWISKWFYGFDIRTKGSGNAGATNTFRVLGTKAGVIVLLLDILKGFLAVYVNRIIAQQNVTLICILAGAFAVTGHIFPLFAQFKGGKGVATMLGVVIGINFTASLIAMAVFIIILLSTNYVSLGSLSGAVSFIITVLIANGFNDVTMLIFAVSVSVVVCLCHISNIKRLLNGVENKTYIFKKRDKK